MALRTKKISKSSLQYVCAVSAGEKVSTRAAIAMPEGRWPLPVLQARLRPPMGATKPFILSENYVKFLTLNVSERNKM